MVVIIAANVINNFQFSFLISNEKNYKKSFVGLNIICIFAVHSQSARGGWAA